MKKSRNLKAGNRGGPRKRMLGYARSIYQRMVDTGADRSDVVAINRLAYIAEASRPRRRGQ